MGLLERYLDEIARRLPRRQRDDVRRELRSALADSLDSRVAGEAAEDDVAALLREFGSPEQVAASYMPEHRYLIGPALYSTFTRVTGVVLTVLVVLVVVGGAIELAIETPAERGLVLSLLALLSEVWDTALSTFGILVLVFALLQRFAAREPAEARWDPSELPPDATTDAELIGRGEAAVGIILPVVFLTMMNLLPGQFGVRVEPSKQMLLNDLFREFLPWINAALLSGILLNAWLWRAGRWQWPTRLFNWAIDAYWIWLLFGIAAGVAARAPVLVAAGVPASLAAQLAGLFTLAAWIVIFAVAWGAAKIVRRHGFGSKTVASA